MDSVEWAAIGLLVTVGVMLLLIMLAYRSRAHRPPPRPVDPSRVYRAGTTDARWPRP